MFEIFIILPKFDKMEFLLPPENVLNSVFNIRTKYLTETENRIKFCFRSTRKLKLENTGFKQKKYTIHPELLDKSGNITEEELLTVRFSNDNDSTLEEKGSTTD